MVTIVLSDFKLRKNYTYYFQEIKMTTSSIKAACQANFLNAKLSRQVKVKDCKVTLETIADLWKTGKLISYNKWLQRLQQEKKWKNNKNKKALEYLASLLGTDGCVQGFLICNISLVLTNLEHKKRTEPKLEKLWSEMIEWLLEKQSAGAEYIILDGQNRLAFAIVPFLHHGLKANLKVLSKDSEGNIFEEELRDVTFDSLYDNENDRLSDLQLEILNTEVILQSVVGGDIRAIRDQIISLNESEEMTVNEKRSTEFTAVSLAINTTASHPTIVTLFKNLPKIFTGEKYHLEKKGDVRFLAEFLHYLRNGSCGSEATLTSMYQVIDDQINPQIDFNNELFLWVAKNLPKTLYPQLVSKEIFRHLFQSLARLCKYGKNHGSLTFNIKSLKQIKKPQIFLTKLVKKLIELQNSDDNFEPRYKTDDKTGELILDDDGNKIQLQRRHKDHKTHSFFAYHTLASEYDLNQREKLFTKHYNEILEECKKSGVIRVNNDARNISTVQMMQAQAEHTTDILDRWETKNLISLKGTELHHVLSVDKNGSNDQDNLVFTKKKLNRQQSNN